MKLMSMLEAVRLSSPNPNVAGDSSLMDLCNCVFEVFEASKAGSFVMVGRTCGDEGWVTYKYQRYHLNTVAAF
jgi:hypothetical protein